MLDFIHSYFEFAQNPDYELFVGITFILGFLYHILVTKISGYIVGCFKRKYKTKLTKEIKNELLLNSNELNGVWND